MPALLRCVLTAGDLGECLEPEGVSAPLTACPPPCCVVRKLPFPPGKTAPAPEGLEIQRGRHGWIAIGSSRALHAFAPHWPALEETLHRAQRRSRSLSFPDGEAWDLAGKTRVMGILNLTPDSFSDGGQFDTVEKALAQAVRMAQEGADLLDLGAESTRPGARPIDAEEEGKRLFPVLRAVRKELPRMRISVDTRRPVVARQALESGAEMINDVSGLGDPEMAVLAARAGCPVVIMHARGTPDRMQQDTGYEDLLGEIADFLDERVRVAQAAGIMDDKIILDPGLGFGKSAEGNEFLLRHIEEINGLGFPVLVGASRKMFIGKRTGVAEPAQRLAGSLAAAVAAALAGAAVVRAHDVQATRQALALADALKRRD